VYYSKNKGVLPEIIAELFDMKEQADVSIDNIKKLIKDSNNVDDINKYKAEMKVF
jgi:hypothetical protein